MKLKLSQLEKILGSSAISPDTIFHGVSIDSRTVIPNNIFIPLYGKNFNGHEYIDDAIKKGAVAVISEIDLKDFPHIKVKSTLDALAKLAIYYSQSMNPITIGITGTNGKTTVTDMTAKILAKYKPTSKTYQNYNNNIGLPLFILKSKKNSEIVVLEMGASKIGDIKELISIARPNIVALLNVSAAHLETFKSIDNILSTKEEIFLNQGFNKTVILNKDDEYFNRWIKKNGHNNVRTISSVNRDSDYSALQISQNQLAIKIPYESLFNLTVDNIESHNILNILFAIAISCEVGARSEHIVPALDHYDGIKGRSKIYNGFNNSKIIDGSYNANPASFKSSINELISLKGTSWVIMGQMGELEDKSEEYHANVAVHAANKGVKKLFLITDHNKAITEVFGHEAYTFSSRSDLIKYIKPLLKNDINVLIKASRFMKFETIVDELIT